MPIIAIAIEPSTRTSRERLDHALRLLEAENPTLRVHTNAETAQVIIGGMSEEQLERVVLRLTTEFGVEAAVGEPRVIYKETVTRAADGEGKFVRQSGRRGQYAHVKIHLLPGAPGSGYVFENGISNGAVPEEFIEPVDQGIREELARGIGAGWAIDDVRVELVDGSYHDVDSTAMAFQIAGAMAVGDAASKGGRVLMEPVMHVEVVAASEVVGEVLADLVRRRGSIQSLEGLGEKERVRARVPLAEMLGYAKELPSLAGADATVFLAFDRYEPCPRPDRDSNEGGSMVREPRGGAGGVFGGETKA